MTENFDGDPDCPACESFVLDRDQAIECQMKAEARVKELGAVAEAALSVYRAWDQDLHYVNKMFAVGRALRDAGYQLRPGHQVSEGSGK